MQGHIREIFTSIQGEGIRMGQRMSFIRFQGCNLSCNYCDTPEAQPQKGFFIYRGKIQQNPISMDEVIDKVDTKIVSLTGGEPLLQAGFVVELCKILKRNKNIVYLDTNASLPEALDQVVKYVDIISLDFKIPTATGRPKLWYEHEECLKISQTKEVFAKMVINENILPSELEKACNIIKRADKEIPLVIQPVFGCGISNLLDIQKNALKELEDVRVIPQVHRYLNLP
jgi:7-carboxy-7-deazaguanine synthase